VLPPSFPHRALKDLAKGEEVTIAYVELSAARQDRREALWEQYGFDINAGQLDKAAASRNSSSTATADTATSADTATTADTATATATAADTATTADTAADTTPSTSYSCGRNSSGGCVAAGMGGLSVLESKHESEQAAGLKPEARPRPQQPISLRPAPLAQQTVNLSAANTKQDMLIRIKGQGGVGEGGGGVDDDGQLLTRIYSLSALPPWPCDPNDSALTQLLLRGCTAQSAVSREKDGSSGNSSSSREGKDGWMGSAGDGADGGCAAGGGSGSSVVILPGGVQVHSLRALPSSQQAHDPAESFEGG